MDPLQYLRLVQRRWLTIVLAMAVGTTFGYGVTSLGDSSTDPEVTYWTASEHLIVNDDAPETVNVRRLAPIVAGEDVMARVAAAAGSDPEDLGDRVRIVSDINDGTLEVSVISTDAGSASAQAFAVAEALQAELAIGRDTEFGEALEAANEELYRRITDRNNLDDLRATEFDPLANAELQTRHDAAVVRVFSAADSLETIERVGVAPAELVWLDSVASFQITEGEYTARLAQGRQGENSFGSNEVSLAKTASVSEDSGPLGAPMRMLAGGFLGLLIGIALVFVQYRLDPRIRSGEEAEDVFGTPVLAAVAMMPRRERRDRVLHALERPSSAIAEAHRYLRSALLFARSTSETSTDSSAEPRSAEREVRVVMVTSPGAGEGKTTTAANLAVTFAEAGYETLLMNCDHRLPTAHLLLGLHYLPGVVQKTAIPHLQFIADVERDSVYSPERITARQRGVIAQARERVDVVILDTAPILATNDAVDLLSVTDLVVLTCREGRTTSAAAEETRGLLDRMAVPVAGLVVTGAGSVMGSRYFERYRYGGYYGSPGLGRPGGRPSDETRASCRPVSTRNLLDWIPDPMENWVDATESLDGSTGSDTGELVDLTPMLGSDS
jgi:Mrp family chromosome partitioning ATPase